MAKKARILITRPVDDAERTARALEDIGMEPVLEPVLTVRFLEDAKLDLTDVQAVLATSANGVRALAKKTRKRDIRLIAVGDQTGAEAKKHGFRDVAAAAGTVDTLADYVTEHVDRDKGVLLHVAPTHLAGDLAGKLKDAGYTYRKVVLYEVDRADRLSENIIREIGAGAIDGVLFYSPRTARLVLELFDKGGLSGHLSDMHAFCLSEPVAKAVKQYTWKGVHTAAKPNQDALMVEVEVALSDNGKKKTSKPEKTKSEKTKAKKSSPAAAKNSGAKKTDGGEKGASSPATSKSQKTGDKDPAAAGSARTLTVAVVAMLVIAAAVVASSPWWYPVLIEPVAGTPTPTADEQDTRRLDARLSALSERLKSVEDRPAAPLPNGATTPAEQAGVEPGRVDELAGKLEGLAGRLDTVSQRLDQIGASISQMEKRLGAQQETIETVRGAQNAAVERVLGETQRLNQDMGALNARMKEIEDAEAAQDKLAGGAAALLLAVGQLKEALNTSASFSAELSAIEGVRTPSLIPEDTSAARALTRLKDHAAKGVPTTAALEARFAELETDALKASVTGKDGSWWERMLNRVTGDMTVRRAEDNLEGDSVAAVTARARVALKAGDLAGAVDALQPLEGPPAQIMAPWIGDARARLGADQAVRALNARALAVMSGTIKQPAAPDRQTNDLNKSGGGAAPKPEDQ